MAFGMYLAIQPKRYYQKVLDFYRHYWFGIHEQNKIFSDQMFRALGIVIIIGGFAFLITLLVGS